MITQIRQQVFETNSSSTHSISINTELTENVLDTTLIPNESGNIILNGGEFGWEYDYFTDAQTKASYLAIYCMDWSGEKSKEFTDILCEVIMEQTGSNGVIFNFIVDDYIPGRNDGYIDHQSVEGNQLHYIFEDKNLIRNFIFNRKSILETNNDNDNGFYYDE